MKIRAGVVSVGLADHVLYPLVTAGKRVHLVGHSFGGRLMTSATAAVDGKISNLSVLEGAFSHNALSIDPDGPINGAFKSVIDNGRITTAHSDHDKLLWMPIHWHRGPFATHYSLRLGGPLGQVFGGPRSLNLHFSQNVLTQPRLKADIGRPNLLQCQISPHSDSEPHRPSGIMYWNLNEHEILCRALGAVTQSPRCPSIAPLGSGTGGKPKSIREKSRCKC
jgi:pimeloyl-ACP methyl ester carboxylesterase